MASQTIILEKKENIATITLNRPERLNALDAQMMRRLNVVLDDVAKDDEVRVLVLTGAGKAFCSGADFRYREIREGKVSVEKAEELKAELDQELRAGKIPSAITTGAIFKLWHLDKPTIAMVNGDAIGGGFDLALACDLRVGSEDARFMVGFTRLAVVPDTGGVWLLPQIAGLAKAAELIFTADFIDAKEAERIGVLNKVVPSPELEKGTMALAQRIARWSPIVHRLNKKLLHQVPGMDLESALMHIAGALNITFGTEDYQEGIRAFAEKRPPVFKGK
jgi:2-(1,2-epoxy-1,2-dihydrophenyl)acetyl-CoA isomerase